MGWAVKRGSRFQARWRDSEGVTRAAGTHPTKREALIAAEDAEKESRGESAGDKIPTWSEWVPEWMADRRADAGTIKKDQRSLDNRLIEKWGDYLVTEISPQMVKKWVTEMEQEGMAVGTIKKNVYLLSGSMRGAMEAGHVNGNPVQGVKFQKAPLPPDRYLDYDECDALKGTMSDNYQFFFDLLLKTGMRWGEAVALHWEDCLDLEGANPRIAVWWAFSREMRYVKTPKDHQLREIPIPQSLAVALAARLEENGWGEPLSRDSYMGARRTHSGLVWGAFNENAWTAEWRAAVRFATVGEGRKKRKVGHCRPYDLRHTFATRLLRAGVDIKKVQALLGHSSVVVTERYARLSEVEIRDVRGSMTGW